LLLELSGVSPVLKNTDMPTRCSCVEKVLLHNGGFYNGCITKRILLLQAYH